MRCAKILKSAVAAVLLISVLMLCGCASFPVSAPTEYTETEPEIEYEPPFEEAPQIGYTYEIRQAQIEYIEEVERDSWREPLERLLSNVITPVYVSGGELIGYVSPNPDLPAMEPWCFSIALFDVDLDGVPEVLGNSGSGSSGGGYYYVHDLMSGEYIGTLHGGQDESWAVYFDCSNGEVETMCEYSLRYGWPSQSYHVSRADIADNVFGRERSVYETSYLKVMYDEQTIEIPLTEEQELAGVHTGYDTAYTAVDFSVKGTKIDASGYYSEYAYFADNYLRLEGTGIRSIYWSDAADEVEDPTERARLMADALISSDQKFVKRVIK